MSNFRTKLSTSQRVVDVDSVIDPGFVNHRKIGTVVGAVGMSVIDHAIRDLPDLSDWLREVRTDHIYMRVLLAWCAKHAVPPLQEVLSQIRDGSQPQRWICSTELVHPCPDVYRKNRRVSSLLAASEGLDFRVELTYSTRHIVADTFRGLLHQGGRASMVAEVTGPQNNNLCLTPYLMGLPQLLPAGGGSDVVLDVFRYDFGELFVEDIDEFSRVRNVPEPPSPEPMKDVSEVAFKRCLAEILGDEAKGDWGGEQSDYYSAHIHSQGRRMSAAFLLKGPGRFSPMGLNHLGTNNDQIVRLAHEPAGLLVVQHCHEILPAVRDTLRVFATQPSRFRRYCLMDGRDSLRLLIAYGLYEKAVAMSVARSM